MDVPIDDFTRFQGCHAGEVAFIMGNGPSLQATPLDLLAGQTVFGGNGGYLIWNEVDWVHRYLVYADSAYLTQRGAEIKEIASRRPDVDVFVPGWVHHWDEGGRQEETLRYTPRSGNIHHYRPLQHSNIHLPFSAVSNNMNNGLVMPFTVTINMIEIAVWMGFTSIVLIGCDTSYKYPSSSNVPGLSRSENHFSKSYPLPKQGFVDPKPERMVWHYQQAKAAFGAYGVDIVNATVGGELEVFPRIPLADVLAALGVH